MVFLGDPSDLSQKSGPPSLVEVPQLPTNAGPVDSGSFAGLVNSSFDMFSFFLVLGMLWVGTISGRNQHQVRRVGPPRPVSVFRRTDRRVRRQQHRDL